MVYPECPFPRVQTDPRFAKVFLRAVGKNCRPNENHLLNRDLQKRARNMSRISPQDAERLIARADTSSRSLVEECALVAQARESRRSAERFAATVRRFSAEMPDNLDRFHDAMKAFRGRARDLKTVTV